MKLSQLIDKLELLKSAHGDIYLSIRHLSEHDFAPDDDLTSITGVRYNPDTNLATLYVNN